MTYAPQFLPAASLLASTAHSTWVSSRCCPVPYAGAQALLTRIIASAADTASAAATTFSPSRSASSTTRGPRAFTRPNPDGKPDSGQTLAIWNGPSMRCAASFGYKEGSKLMREFPPPPPRAQHHCRHYSCDLRWLRSSGVGPQCGLGVIGDDVKPCMPDGTGCVHREEWSDLERQAHRAWSEAYTERCMSLLAAVPEGIEGMFGCPNCGSEAWYSRSSHNGHIYAACTTPNCSGILQ